MKEIWIAYRTQSIAAELYVDIGGVGAKTDITISVKSVEEKTPDAMSTPVTRLLLEWEFATKPHLFPLMKRALSIYPLTATETELDFWGLYEQPFGAVGKAVNAIVGHRIAEVPVHRFISDVVGYLREALAQLAVSLISLPFPRACPSANIWKYPATRQ